MITVPQILLNLNITALNPMQEKSLESIETNNNVILISPTGTGKTLAFLLPLIPLLNENLLGVQVLIIVPSRELAIQIESVFKQMGTPFKINSCYGGHQVRVEEHNLSQPPAILVGTPGRLGHHIRKNNLNLSETPILILDEFDKSLEFGFKDEMEFIIKNCQNIKKRILTSATELKEIPNFVGLKNELILNFLPSESVTENKNLITKFVRVVEDDKLEALMLLLGNINEQSIIVFCNHRDAVNRISEQLDIHKVQHGFYHGGLEQIDRERTLIKLRNESTRILITTDLASRGLDIPEIGTVIHYQLPFTEDVMIHRNGRTARMHASGTVYYLLDKEDFLPKFITEQPIEESLPKKFMLPKPSEWQTLYLSAGKKDKINKMDIVGMLLQKGGLQKDELGKIEVLDFSAFVAVKRHKINQTLSVIKDEKIKNKKIKIEIAL
jgi:ATP-independent RNA helicase DbpA